MTQTVVIHGDRQRKIAAEIIAMAPKGAVVTVKAATRTLDQNALLWAVLSDISRAKPEGRRWTPETWKAAFMHTLGHQVQFCEGLDDSGPFPLGFRSSRLTVGQMADLLTVALEYGDRHGVAWSDEARDER